MAQTNKLNNKLLYSFEWFKFVTNKLTSKQINKQVHYFKHFTNKHIQTQTNIFIAYL